MIYSSTTEAWKSIPGYEGLYEMSTFGRLKSLSRTVRGPKGPRIMVTKILKGYIRGDGYVVHRLRKDGEEHRWYAHALVLHTFVGPRPEGMDIRHLDGDPSSNHLNNLAYGTRSENMLDTLRHGTNQNVLKTHCPQGHPYDEENTTIQKQGHARYCRACMRDNYQRRKGSL